MWVEMIDNNHQRISLRSCPVKRSRSNSLRSSLDYEIRYAASQWQERTYYNQPPQTTRYRSNTWRLGWGEASRPAVFEANQQHNRLQMTRVLQGLIRGAQIRRLGADCLPALNWDTDEPIDLPRSLRRSMDDNILRRPWLSIEQQDSRVTAQSARITVSAANMQLDLLGLPYTALTQEQMMTRLHHGLSAHLPQPQLDHTLVTEQVEDKLDVLHDPHDNSLDHESQLLDDTVCTHGVAATQLLEKSAHESLETPNGESMQPPLTPRSANEATNAVECVGDQPLQSPVQSIIHLSSGDDDARQAQDLVASSDSGRQSPMAERLYMALTAVRHQSHASESPATNASESPATNACESPATSPRSSRSQAPSGPTSTTTGENCELVVQQLEVSNGTVAQPAHEQLASCSKSTGSDSVKARLYKALTVARGGARRSTTNEHSQPPSPVEQGQQKWSEHAKRPNENDDYVHDVGTSPKSSGRRGSTGERLHRRRRGSFKEVDNAHCVASAVEERFWNVRTSAYRQIFDDKPTSINLTKSRSSLF